MSEGKELSLEIMLSWLEAKRSKEPDINDRILFSACISSLTDAFSSDKETKIKLEVLEEIERQVQRLQIGKTDDARAVLAWSLIKVRTMKNALVNQSLNHI